MPLAIGDRVHYTYGDGQLPSAGWTIGYRIEHEPGLIRRVCWPVPPR